MLRAAAACVLSHAPAVFACASDNARQCMLLSTLASALDGGALTHAQAYPCCVYGGACCPGRHDRRGRLVPRDPAATVSSLRGCCGPAQVREYIGELLPPAARSHNGTGLPHAFLGHHTSMIV